MLMDAWGLNDLHSNLHRNPVPLTRDYIHQFTI